MRGSVSMSILVTGGAGYIGSHTCVELLDSGYEVVVADNLCNSNKKAIDRIEKITGKKVKFYECDIRDKDGLNKIFDNEEIIKYLIYGINFYGSFINIIDNSVLCNKIENF